ncbi:Insect pheromone-binding, A10/OS-D [Homalodisca vitripennis]|nr:Insect pheromone-binding, A10/OS-D [Homalodisca vitripennis]
MDFSFSEPSQDTRTDNACASRNRRSAVMVAQLSGSIPGRLWGRNEFKVHSGRCSETMHHDAMDLPIAQLMSIVAYMLRVTLHGYNDMRHFPGRSLTHDHTTATFSPLSLFLRNLTAASRASYRYPVIRNFEHFLQVRPTLFFYQTLPDALKTGCSKCTEKQKAATDKVIRHLRKNKSHDWNRLVNKYDPNGEFRSKYEARLSDARR